MKAKLENQHFEMMQKMRQAWKEQYESMKQIHIEFKNDIEGLIQKRDQQIHELNKGNCVELFFRRRDHS